MRTLRILIIDDDAVDRLHYRKLLTLRGFDPCHITEASDGAAGLAALRGNEFDCVLLDYSLPDMTGFELLAAAAIAVDGEPRFAVVLITGPGNDGIVVEAMKRGVPDCLAKDQVDADNLWRSLTQALTRAELRQSDLSRPGLTRGYRVLVVDDEPTDRAVYRKLLAEQGPEACELREVADGAAGLAALQTDEFDCVLLDFKLPDMTGLEFLTAAALDGELPCAIVLVTGQGNEAIAVEAMKRGVQDYLVKDEANASSLWRILTRAVSQVELRQGLAASVLELAAANRSLEGEVATRKGVELALLAAKELAEQANQAKTRFVAMVTHELRTPLNGILGYAQLLRIEGGLTGRQNAHVGAMMQAGQHLLELVERVLDFASIETAEMKLHPEEVSVRQLTEGCITFIGPMATARGLSLLVVNAHDTPRHIMADPARLRQVLLNLLGNAVKFTESGSVELRVLSSALPGGLRFEVADTGRGIDKADRGRLFQDFERLDGVTSVEGTGLGLAIAMRIVKLMGGTINYSANPTLSNPKGGSVFWFDLPPTELAAPSASEPIKTVAQRSGKRVLLVDDIKINRDIIGAFLNAAGHVVTLAEGGEEAVELAAEQYFDVILMDVRMPGVDGLEATRRIRRLPVTQRRVPIVALTAYTFPDQVAQCLDAGMDGHLSKPVDYETLISAIDAVISRVSAPDEEGCVAAGPSKSDALGRPVLAA